MSKILGAHSVINSTNPKADRAFFRDVLKFPNVDAGDGWLIFGLPDSEVAFHPSEENNVHEFYLLCEDVNAFIGSMEKQNAECSPARNLGWGILTQITLPGGGKIGVYQPRHKRPKAVSAKATKKAKVKTKSKPKSRVKKTAKAKFKKK